MRITLGCGLLEAGLAACVSTLCLSPLSALPQSPEVQPNLSTGMPDAAAVQRIQEQQQALFEAITRIQQDSETALNRYTDAVLTQFNLLQESFAAQQAKDIAAVERLNRFTRNVVLLMVGGMVLSALVIAWVPLWATSRMTKHIVELGRRRSLLSDSVPPDSSLEIEAAINRLEQRLLTLESEPTAPSAVTQPPPAAKTPAPHVAMAVGDSSALVFLPHDIEAPRWAGFRRQLTNLKKLWSRAT